MLTSGHHGTYAYKYSQQEPNHAGCRRLLVPHELNAMEELRGSWPKRFFARDLNISLKRPTLTKPLETNEM